MKRIFFLLAMASVAIAQDQPLSGPVVLEFIEAEKFTDFSDNSFDPGNALKEFSKEVYPHLVNALKSGFPEGTRLVLRFKDIDLAGGFEPWRSPNLADVRIVKSSYPPRAEFEYEFTDKNGTVLASGTDKVADLTFDMRMSRNTSSERYPHDRAMLVDWIRKQAATKK